MSDIRHSEAESELTTIVRPSIDDEAINPVIMAGNQNVDSTSTNGESKVNTSDIITQTDRNGKPMASRQPPKPAARVTPPANKSEPSCLQKIFCCMCFGEPTTKAGNSVRRVNSGLRATSPNVPRCAISGSTSLLKAQPPNKIGKKCLVLDLDETLVHSSFQKVDDADFTIPVNIDHTIHNVYVLKRPGVDEFLARMSVEYEIVIYTASLSKYADPLLDRLDKQKVINSRLFRESCVYYDGHYIKDLSLLNRDITQCIIVDNSPMSYTFHPDNAIDCGTYIDDPADIEMWQIADFLEAIVGVSDVRGKCRGWRYWCERNPSSVPNSPNSNASK